MSDRLYFAQINVAEELASEANARMTCEQWGAFWRLLLRAWLSPQCSLPNDDVALAQLSGLGKRWKTAGAFVREQFEELEDDATRIRNRGQWELYQDSLDKHEARVNAGRIGGEAKAKAKQNASIASPMPEQRPTTKSQSHSEKIESHVPRSEYSNRLIDVMNETLGYQLGQGYRRVLPDQYASLQAAARLQQQGVPLASAERHLRQQCRLFNPTKHGKGKDPSSLAYFEQGILKAWKSEPAPIADLISAYKPSLDGEGITARAAGAAISGDQPT
jgi:uncharacterized protein YdaU (DUF1376 family)